MDNVSATLGSWAGWLGLAALTWYVLRVVAAMGLLWWADHAGRPTTTTWAWQIAPASSRRAIRRVLASGIVGMALVQPLALADTCPEPPAGIALLDRGLAPCSGAPVTEQRPVVTEQPVEPGQPVEPEQPVEPGKPATPEQPAHPATHPPAIQRSSATVTVARGDSLWSLTQQQLGTTEVAVISASWPALWQENRDTIGPNPDVLMSGQVLTLPAHWSN